MVRVKPSEFKDKLKKIPLINVGWTQFTVEIVPDKIIIDGEACWGMCDFEHSKIKLSNKTPEPMIRQTFLHELMHVVLETLGYGADTEKDGVLPLNINNEDLTEHLTKGLILLINLNPDLRELLF